MNRSELDVSLDELRVFVAVAEQGSMLGASSVLQVSRATVRRQMDQLEETLGFKLVFRNREGVELSEQGHSFLQDAKNLLGLARETIARAREFRPEPQRKVRVAVQVGYPLPFTTMLDMSTYQRFPGTTVEYFVSERPADLVPDKADIAMCLGEQRPRAPCIAQPLLTLKQRLLAAPSYIETHGPFESVEAARGHVIGCWRGPDGDQGALHLMDGGRLAISPRTITSDESYLRAMGSLGRGLIYAPLPLNDGLHLAEPLVPVLDDQVGRPVPILMYTLEASSKLPIVKFVVDMSRQVLEEYNEGTSTQALAPSI
ncbi:MAG: LysR family transcriptional regulator [Myxococcota bacterium]